MTCNLSTKQILTKMNRVKLTGFKKKSRNKGFKGMKLEKKLGIPCNSQLTDMTDGELKSFTVGQSIKITSLGHCLSEIINKTQFKDCKLGTKTDQILFVGFNKDGDYMGHTLLNQSVKPNIYRKVLKDYNYICKEITKCYKKKELLHTITGPQNFLQIRTAGNKNKDGNYTPLIYNDTYLNDKYMAFYFTADFGRNLLNN